MIVLTWPGGQKVEISGKTVMRIRAVHRDIDGPNGRSRVDWVQTDLFEEEPELIADKVKGELSTLVSLTMPGGKEVWFNGAKATGPIYVVPTNRGNGVGSALKIGQLTQYVRESPEEVSQAIESAGGVVLPIRRDLP